MKFHSMLEKIESFHRWLILLRWANLAECILYICLLLNWVILPVTARSEDSIVKPGNVRPFRIAFTRGIFSDVSTTDGKAALKAWSQALAEERGIKVQTSALVYDSVEEVNQAFRKSKLDAATVLMQEYLYIDKAVTCGPYLVSEKEGSFREQYVLLVQDDSNIRKLMDLRGLSISLYDHYSSSMALPWLDLALYNEVSETVKSFFSEIKYSNKFSSVVLSVFFRKQDSCMVTMNGFKTMVDLNPQVGKQLRILIGSPMLIPSMFCFSEDMAPDLKDQIVDAILHSQETLGGKQILHIFKATGMKEVREKDIKESLELIAKIDLLRKQEGMVIK